MLPAAAVLEKEVLNLSGATIMPYFLEHFTTGLMKDRDGVDICYAKAEAAGGRGAVVVVDGRTEFIAKYAEVFYDLRNSGFSFYIYDHRGQGESSRLLADPQKGHVRYFSDYIEDLHRFLEKIVNVKRHSSVFLLSHSMGGPISILYQRKYPGTVTGMILCSPMLSINTSPYPQVAAKIMVRIFTALGMGCRYVIDGRPYDSQHPFENSPLTDSYARFELNRKLVEENPRVALGSPTYRWLSEAFSAMDRIAADTTAIEIPILLMVGEEDTIVGTAVQKKFCSVQPNCTLVILAHGKHELLMEKDQVRDAVLENIRGFLDRNLTGDAVESRSASSR